MEQFTIPIFAANLIGFTSDFTSALKNTLIDSTSSLGPGILPLCHSTDPVIQPQHFSFDWPNTSHFDRLNTSHFDRLNASLSTNRWGTDVVSKNRKIQDRINQFSAPVHRAKLKDFTLYLFICNHWFSKNPGR